MPIIAILVVFAVVVLGEWVFIGYTLIKERPKE
jgi:hypothetical protein